jgi:hypothetical protein
LLHYTERAPSRFPVFSVNFSLVILASFSLTTCETLNIAEALGGLKIFILQIPFLRAARQKGGVRMSPNDVRSYILDRPEEGLFTVDRAIFREAEIFELETGRKESEQ